MSYCDVRVAYSNMRNLQNQTISKIPSYFSLFWQQKDLDFTLKVIGGDLSALPGVSDAIEVPSKSHVYGISVIPLIFVMLVCRWYITK